MKKAAIKFQDYYISAPPGGYPRPIETKIDEEVVVNRIKSSLQALERRECVCPTNYFIGFFLFIKFKGVRQMVYTFVLIFYLVKFMLGDLQMPHLPKELSPF